MIARDTPLFADLATELLGRGHRVRFRAEGGSMHPAIRGGQAIVVEAVRPHEIRVGEVVLYRAGARLTAHRVVRIDAGDAEKSVFTLRGDAAGSREERVDARQVLGRVCAVEGLRRGRLANWLARLASGRAAVAAFVLAVAALALVPALPAHAATCTSLSTGAWNNAGRWSCPGVPGAADDVIIADGHTITLNTSVTINSLQVGQGTSGSLDIGNNNTNRTLTVSGNVTVNAGASLITSGNGGNVLNIGGDLVNDGTFDLNIGGSDADVFFNGTAAQSISGSGATMDLNSITISNTTQPVTTSRNFAVAGTMTVNNGATFNVSTSAVVSGGGTFTLAAGGTLGIGDANGITTAACGTGGTCGSIRTTTRTFPTGGSYTYNGTGAQNVGNGVPTNLTGTLTINNPGNTVTLDNARTIANTGTVSIVDGTFAAGTNLTMATTSTINRSGGSMTGTPQGAGTYDVIYSGSAELTTGTELNGTGQRNITLTDTVVVTAGAAITTTTAGVLAIGGGTTFIQAGTQLATCSGNNLSIGRMTIANGGFFANCATGVDDNGGTGTLTFTGSAPNLSVAAGGRFDYIGSGTITFLGAGAFTNNITNSGVIRINGGSNTCNVGGVTITTSNSPTVSRWNVGAGSFFLADVNLVRQVANPSGTVRPVGLSTIGSGSSGWLTPAGACPGSLTLISLESFTAQPVEGGNRLSVRTSRDVNNLGFNLYREVNGRKVKLNASLLAGSALMASAGTTFTAGQSRRWLDRDGLPGAVYWLEEVDLRGTRTWYGPAVAPVLAAGKAASAEAQPVQELNAARPSPAPAAARDEELTTAVKLSDLGRSARAAKIAPAAAASPATARKATPESLAKQYELAAGAAVRLGVKAEGWYRVTQPELVAAGMSAAVDPRKLQLYLDGVEQPIHVQSAVKNQFGAQDALYFYGRGMDSPWSDTQVYWLVAGPGNGLRMSLGGAALGAEGARNFAATLAWKPRELYFPALINGDQDNFFGPVVTDVAVSQVLTVSHLDASGGAGRLSVALQGVSEGAHTVTVTLNGAVLGKVLLSGQGRSVASFAVPALNEGANTLTLAGANADDVSAVDEVQLTYPRRYIAEADALRFTAQAGQATRVDGFASTAITVIDITDPAAPSLIQAQAGAGAQGQAITVVPVTGTGTRTLLAVGASQVRSPAISVNAPSTWHAAQAGHDMVIVGHKSLLASAGPLASLRQSQGLKVATIDVEDLYDEFNFGARSPYALKAFLANAKANWTTKPRFVLLLGNGTYDPRNYLATSIPDLVPVKLVDTEQLETASDDWFVDFDDDGIPDMAIGRLPAETVAQAERMLGRTVSYDQAATASWMSRALLVSGSNKNSSDNFAAQSVAVQALLPGTVTASHLVQATDPNPAGNLVAGINAGQALLNFLGHGSVEVWSGSLFDSTAALALTNGTMAPVVLTMTCLNGYFHDVYTNALGKALLNAASGGAVAVWASSGLTDPDPQGLMNQAMVQALYSTPVKTLGQAAAAAKAAVTDIDVRRTWVLLGDPSTVIQ